MTADEFNALPLDARQYIEKQKTCLSCGKAQDLNTHLRNFYIMKNGNLFTLRTGAIGYRDADGKGAILYPIHPADSEEVIKSKLAQAVAVHAVAPHKFATFNEEKIEKVLKPAEVKKAPLTGAAKAAADKKAAKAAEEAEAAAKAAEEAEAAAKAAEEAEAAAKAAEEDAKKDLLG